MRLIILILLFCLSLNGFGQNKVKNDSITFLYNQSSDERFSPEKRLAFALKASKLAEETKNDSLILKVNRYLSFMYAFTGNSNLHYKTNLQNLKLAKEINDSLSLVVANHNLALYHHNEAQNDSAYFYYSKSLKLYGQLKNIRKKAEILLNIADLQETEKDYIGSEERAVEAIKLFNELPKSEFILDQLWILNNLIGIISLKLKNYDKALEYHDKALNISLEMKEGYYNNLYSLNNQAIVYRKKGDLDKSIELYQKVIDEDGLDIDDTSFYALTLGNLAYAKSLKENRDIKEVGSLFEKAYHISDTLQDPLTKLGVAIDYSRFHLDIGELESAKSYANISYRIAKELSSNDLVLESLLLLSDLSEGKEVKEYLSEHIRLSDSLLNVERNVRNKFARIELETEQLEIANEKMSEQLMWLLAISGGLLVTFFLLYIIITQRARNKELRFEQDQQKANEEIYNLMLSQQDKVDEARAGEKKRISEELHDGILGRLFGTRLSLDSLNFSEGQEAIKNRATYIKELMTIENDIRKVSHDLNTDFVSGSGFMDIVSELIEKQTVAYQLDSSFDYTDDINWESVPNKTKINIYRIIQESLQNIYKHANANSVKISIQLKNNVICLSIIDDGDGFDVNKSKKGIGLKNINSRVNEVEGKAEFNSILKEGTEVSITIPYKN
ncbi:tetratricopeptide repeat protein [uncultured Psychroserpens sp.]|uniref:tetratricopeptide repeat-containing sensor histidine kinase n=1 Tax=uncultured Psychroserpens sp. TaxID=255436 RepID=UPI002625F70C|nr:tetratricopeptide repeat protein [uncultured Psychroserpens sp.]